MNLKLFFSLALCLSLGLAGCMTVPRLEGPASIPVQAVTERIKCDIWHVFHRKIAENKRFAFLSDWSAKAHITLVMDDMATLNPGATVVNPLSAGANTAGNFNLGIGLGAIGEAVATTDIEFYMSFATMEKEYNEDRSLSLYNGCILPNGNLIDSDLQLDQVFDNALTPVGTGILAIGHNPSPGAPAQAVAPDGAQLQAAIDKFEKARPKIEQQKAFDRLGDADKEKWNQIAKQQLAFRNNQLVLQHFGANSESHGAHPNPGAVQKTTAAELYDAEEIQKNKVAAQAISDDADLLVKSVISPLADLINQYAPKCNPKIVPQRAKALIDASIIATQKVAIDLAKGRQESGDLIVRMNSELSSLFAGARAFSATIRSQCLSPEKPAPANVPLNDPLNLISQTVNFYITVSGSVTPTWKLVQVSAPLATTFASGSRKYTDTLIVAFGRPQADKTAPALDNQILISNIRSALQNNRF